MPRINFNLRVEVLNGLLDLADGKIGAPPIAGKRVDAADLWQPPYYGPRLRALDCP